MNDFLQTLRSNHADKQRSPMTRRHYDETFQHTVPRYQYVNRTAPSFCVPGQSQDQGNDAFRLQAAVENLDKHMRTLVLNQKYLIDTQNKIADMLERQVQGMEKILDHLEILSG